MCYTSGIAMNFFQGVIGFAHQIEIGTNRFQLSVVPDEYQGKTKGFKVFVDFFRNHGSLVHDEAVAPRFGIEIPVNDPILKERLVDSTMDGRGVHPFGAKHVGSFAGVGTDAKFGEELTEVLDEGGFSGPGIPAESLLWKPFVSNALHQTIQGKFLLFCKLHIVILDVSPQKLALKTTNYSRAILQEFAMDNKITTLVGVILLVLLSGGIGFLAGRHYEREQGSRFELRINNNREVEVDTGKGRIKAPFVDIEYDK